MSAYDEKGVCDSNPEALLAAFRDVDALVGLPDYAVIFCCSPWPDGGWMAGFEMDDKDWAMEQGLESRFLPQTTHKNDGWSIFDGFKNGVVAHGSHLAEAIENAVAKVRELSH